MSRAYLLYRGEKVPVTVESVFQGGTGLIANVKAVTGYPFHSVDVEAQGETFTAWSCNGLRVCADFVKVESDPEPQDVETLTTLAYGCADLAQIVDGVSSKAWWNGIVPIPL